MERFAKFSEYLADSNRAPFLFVGSGLSRRYLGLEAWSDLLAKFCVGLKRPYNYYKSSHQSLPETALHIAKDFHEFWWGDSTYSGSREVYESKVVNDASPLKYEISKYLSGKSLVSNDYGDEIDLLRSVIVDGIITTNWDCFLESVFSDFHVYVGQNDLLFKSSHQVAEIYKIHGSCTSPESLVLTADDYSDFHVKYPYLVAKLMTIFLEHPVIFLGYSLSDDNIQNILTSISNCLSGEQLNRFAHQLFVVEWYEGEPSCEDTFYKVGTLGHTIPITLIKANSFAPIFEILGQRQRTFPANILRQLKEHVYNLVKKVDLDVAECMYVQDIDSEDGGGDLQVVFGVGVAERFKEFGYSPILRDDVLADVVFDNKLFDSEQILCKTIDSFLKKGVKYVPVFKYISDSTGDDGGISFQLPQSIISHVESFSPDILFDINVSQKRMALWESYGDMRSFLNSGESLKDILRTIPCVGFSGFDVDALGTFLKHNYDHLVDFDGMERNIFIKVLCVYDYIKYSAVYKLMVNSGRQTSAALG